MSEVFYTGLYSSLIGCVLALVSQCYRSKCKEVKFCCIRITRDVEAEEEIDRNPIQSPIVQSQARL